MIVLLICSTNLSISSATLLRGYISQEDSVYISYDDLRKANSKLIEVEYLKLQNNILKDVHSTDSIIIELKNNNINQLKFINNQNNQDIKKIKLQRNISYGINAASIIGIILLLLLH